jgi:hypothetical protein
MKATMIYVLAVLSCLVLSLNAAGQPAAPKPNWDRALALEAVRNTDTPALLAPLFQLARSGNDQELMVALSAIAQDPEISAPARDYIVFKFSLGLSDLEAGAVSPQVLEFLSYYRPLTLVAHVDHPRTTVPLFNTRAATAGLRNHWERQEASFRAEKLLTQAPERWVESYLAADTAGRRGFEDSLDFASPGPLRELGWHTLTLLDSTPDLTLVTARAGMDSGDSNLLQQALMRGDGAGLSRAFRMVSEKMDDAHVVLLLNHTLNQASDSRASLAIAHLAPTRLEDPAIREMMFNTLADQNLGAAAALVLSASPDPEIQSRLREIASEKDGLAQHRAALALSVRRAGGGAEQ